MGLQGTKTKTTNKTKVNFWVKNRSLELIDAISRREGVSRTKVVNDLFDDHYEKWSERLIKELNEEDRIVRELLNKG